MTVTAVDNIIKLCKLVIIWINRHFGKLIERLGRKAMGLKSYSTMIARPPQEITLEA